MGAARLQSQGTAGSRRRGDRRDLRAAPVGDHKEEAVAFGAPRQPARGRMDARIRGEVMTRAAVLVRRETHRIATGGRDDPYAPVRGDPARIVVTDVGDVAAVRRP